MHGVCAWGDESIDMFVGGAGLLGGSLTAPAVRGPSAWWLENLLHSMTNWSDHLIWLIGHRGTRVFVY